MIFNDYKIPENITVEDEFMYNLISKLYEVGSHTGFVLGEFHGLIKHMKENNVSDELIKEAEHCYKSVEEHLKEYNIDIYKFVSDRWVDLGKPLSLEAHRTRKRQVEIENENKVDL